MVPLHPSAPPTKRLAESADRVQGPRFIARAFHKWDAYNFLFVAIGVVAVAVVWTLVLERIAFEQSETIADVKKDNASLARALEEHTVMTLAGVDQALHFLMYQYSQQGRALSVRKTLADGNIDDSIFTDMAIVDEQGTRILGRDDARPISVTDREYFKFHRGSASHELFIGQPTLGRITGKWAIHMSLRIDKPDGSFGGVALGSIDPTYFTRFYEDAELGEHGLVTLVGLDGITRARQVGKVGSFGADMRGSTLFANLAKSANGSFISVGRLDGTPRYYSYRTLHRYPLVVAVATSEELTLEPYRERARNYRMFAALATACIIGLVIGAQLLLSWRRAHDGHIEYLATHDAVTDLPNQNLLNDRVAQAINHAGRARTQLAVIVVDINNFNYINDGFGRSVGDDLLRTIARELATLVRPGETVARIGGDEFVLLIDDGKDAAHVATTVARKVLERFARAFAVGTREFTVVASIGISLYPADGQDTDRLLMNADAAMHHAKETGRNTFQFSAPEMKNRAIERATLEASLRRAVQLEEFELHYQPIILTDTCEPVAVEALVRWRHPDEGLIPPMKFIPVAEETGLIVPIGEWVLRTACAQNKAWQDAGLPPLTVSVNLSALQLHQPGLVDLVASILEETGLDARYLDLELTETMVMSRSQAVIECLHALKALGVTLSLDDFGTGYSNLGYLKSFPLDHLKVDRSFVKDLSESKNAASIVRAIVTMGHSLGLAAVAEGVETAAQAQFLAGIGCERCQGYLFSKPLPPGEFATWLAADYAARMQVARHLEFTEVVV